MSDTPRRTRRIPIPKQAYPLESPPADAEDLLNFYAEAESGEARSTYILRPTPGTSPWLTALGAGPVQAMEPMGDLLYIVSGGRAYRRIGETITQDLGAVPGSGLVTIAVGLDQVMFCNPPNAYLCQHGGLAVSQVTDGAFPGASSVAYLDGYFVFTQPNTAQFFVSKLADASTYDALDDATIEAMPGKLYRVMSHLGALWFFGSEVVEVWQDVGQGSFAFQRASGGAIYGGTASPLSIAQVDNTLIFLGRDNIVYQLQGLQAVRISTSALEQQLTLLYDPAGVQDQALGMAYVQQGHSFYVLTLPRVNNGAGITWVYDLQTKLWHRRSNAFGTGRWRAQCAALYSGSVFIGDAATGQVYTVQPETGADNGVPIQRMAVFPPITDEARRVFMHRLEFELDLSAETMFPDGTYHDPRAPLTITVDWSDDGGVTYGPTRVIGVRNVLGKRRVYTSQLGSFQESRTLRLRSQGLTTIYAADADMTAGAT